MFETAPDRTDIEEYEAEQDILRRLRKRLAHEYELADERMDEEYEFI